MTVRTLLVASLVCFTLNLSAQDIIVDSENIGRFISREEFRELKKGLFTLKNGNHWRLHEFGFFRKDKRYIELYPNAHIDKISKLNKSSKIAVGGIGLLVLSPQSIEMPHLINQLNQIQISSSSNWTVGDDIERLESGGVIFFSIVAFEMCDLVDRILINRYLNGKSRFSGSNQSTEP